MQQDRNRIEPFFMKSSQNPRINPDAAGRGTTSRVNRNYTLNSFGAGIG